MLFGWSIIIILIFKNFFLIISTIFFFFLYLGQIKCPPILLHLVTKETIIIDSVTEKMILERYKYISKTKKIGKKRNCFEE